MNSYIKTKILDIPTSEMVESCNAINRILNEQRAYYELKQQPTYGDVNSPYTTKMFGCYNIFTFPLPHLHKLYREIQTFFHEHRDVETDYYIQCWMNYTNTGEYLDWHHHHEPGEQSWHGYYCVSVGNSKTTYKIPGMLQDVDVISKENLLVLSRSEGDLHRTYPWEGDHPRITIAFDIIPRRVVPIEWRDHWIPI